MGKHDTVPPSHTMESFSVAPQPLTQSTHLNVMSATSGSPLTIPGGFLLGAQFLRAGSDLRLIAEDGHEVLIRGYFDHDPPPRLDNDLGGSISGAVAARLAGPLAPGQYAENGGGGDPRGRRSARSLSWPVTFTSNMPTAPPKPRIRAGPFIKVTCCKPARAVGSA